MSYIIQGIDYNQKFSHWSDICKSQNYQDVLEEVSFYNSNKDKVNFDFRIIERKETVMENKNGL